MSEFTDLLSGNLDTVAIFGLFVYLWHKRATARDAYNYEVTVKALNLAAKCLSKKEDQEERTEESGA